MFFSPILPLLMSGLHGKHSEFGLMRKIHMSIKCVIQQGFSAIRSSRVLLDNITQDIEAKGREFKSHRAHHIRFRGFKGSSMKFLPLFFPLLN
jgi:hypothetical protein